MHTYTHACECVYIYIHMSYMYQFCMVYASFVGFNTRVRNGLLRALLFRRFYSDLWWGCGAENVPADLTWEPKP